jgi:preprotein translocase SecE subunit
MVLVVFVAFFVVKGLYDHATQPFTAGGIFWMLVYVGIGFLLVQFFRTGRFATWAVAIDQGGWLDTHTHKKTQGLRVRRLTILGILLVAGSGIWTMMNHNYLPANTTVRVPVTEVVNGVPTQKFVEQSNRMGDWVIGGQTLQPDPKESAVENRARPRHEGGVTILPDLQFTVPLVLIAATLWFAWRLVNYPVFADFLIATEAEINKVSWTSRRALVRDTIVVLTTLILLTLFLFVVDMFWNTLLSREWVGVLPTAKEQAEYRSEGDTRPVTDW